MQPDLHAVPIRAFWVESEELHTILGGRLMPNLNTIVAASDFSGASTLAVDRGLMLARDQKARYVVIHALGSNVTHALRSIAGTHLDTDELAQTITQQSEDQLREVIADCPHHNGIAVEINIEADSATSGIPKRARDLNADLLIVGAHGTGFVQRVLVGSTATRLLRKAHCPVLVVKQPAHRAYRRVLVAVDFSAISHSSIMLAQRIAPDAHFILTNTFEVPFEGRMQMAGVSEELLASYRDQARVKASYQLQELAKKCNLSEDQYTAIASHGQAARDILQLEHKYRCDLVVMGKHGTNATAELLLGSVTRRVLADSASDVLVVTDEQIFPQRIS